MSTFAYTIGAEKSYDLALTNPSEPATKLGQRLEEDPPYGGGWVWRTAEEAHSFIQDRPLCFVPAVYELLLPTSWEADVSQDVDEAGVHRLLHDALIMRKVPGSDIPARA